MDMPGAGGARSAVVTDNRLGGGLLASIDASPGEQVRMSWRANRTQHSRRAVGGKLMVTTHRMVFLPHRLDAITGGQVWCAALAECQAAGVEPKGGDRYGGDRYGGGLRDRLRIDTDSGPQLFVVNTLDQVRAAIGDAITATPRP
jgi:hypothetical protein